MRISRMVLAAAAAGLLAPAPASAQVGATLEAARAGAFWTAFDLRTRGTVDPLPTWEFRPGREPLASRAVVSVTTGDDGTIRGMTLTVAREVVDDPAHGALARALAAGFLRAAMPADDRPDVEALARALEHPDAHPHAAEGAQAVYLGHADEWSRTLEASILRLHHEPGPRGRLLVVRVDAR